MFVLVLVAGVGGERGVLKGTGRVTGACRKHRAEVLRYLVPCSVWCAYYPRAFAAYARKGEVMLIRRG